MLDKVLANFQRRARRFATVLNAAESVADRGGRDRAVSFVAIELQTAFAYVARSAFLAGMVGGRRANGTAIRPAAVVSKRDALVAGCKAVGCRSRRVPGRDEPAWHSSDHLSRVLSAAPANAGDLTSALGIFPSARRAVLSARNFYAHRSRHTLSELDDVLTVEYGAPMAGHPTDELCRAAPGHASSFLDVWISNYLDMADALCGA